MTRDRAMPVQLFVFIVLVISGTYLLVYLYRWQWNRAMISGIFFVAAEISLATMTVLRRLRALERRVAQSQPQPQPVGAADEPDTTSPEGAASEAFRWLEPTGNGMAVFVPVLMGAGVILSALAYVIDRAAAMTAPAGRSNLERLGRLAVPTQGLLTPLARPPGPVTVAPAGGWRRQVRITVGALVAVAVTAIAIDVVADATQTRPEAAIAGHVTVIDVEIHHKRNRPVLQSAEALWAAARMTIPRGTELVSLTETGDQRVRMVLSPALGTHARRRVTGALEDASIDNVSSHVVSLQTVAE